MDEDIKQAWEEKIRATYANSSQLLIFITETMNNFAYRYISNSEYPSPTVNFLNETTLEVCSLENNMGNALKMAHPEIKTGVKQLAKAIPHTQKPTVKYSIVCKLDKLTPDHGKLQVKAIVNWNFPTHDSNPESEVISHKTFVWDDLQVFRKGFPLAIQEVCDLFL